MVRALLEAVVALVLALLAFSDAPAHAQGRIGTLARGTYICELPGDAAGKAGIEQPDLSFSIDSASRYHAKAGSGTYLRRGEVVEMTSGPHKGERFQLVSERFLRQLEDGKPGRLRCIKR